MMRFLRQSMIGLFLTALALGLLVYAAHLISAALQDRLADDPFTAEANERVFAVNVTTAQATDVVPVIETFGEVRSTRTLELRAAVAGRVTDLSPAFADGGVVAAGDVLAKIDPADAQSAVDRAGSDVSDAVAEVRDADRSLELARADLAAAQEQADLRQRAFTRQQDLAGRGVGTSAATETAELAASAARQAVVARRQAVAQAQARIDQAATRRARADIALAEAQRRLADTTITAPFDGTLSDTAIVQGRLVGANERLAELIDPRALEISFRLSTAQYARLLNDQGTLINAQVSVTLDVSGIDLEARGSITRASATAGAGSTGRLVFARLDAAPGFKPGDFVTVNVAEPQLVAVVRLPAAALGPGEQVLVVGDDDRLLAVTVDVLRRQGDDVLVQGPVVDREIVLARSPLLGAGIKVRPVRRDAAPQDAPEMLNLTEERRARLVAFVQANDRMPAQAKERVLARLSQPQVPARMVARLESRMGG